MMSHELEDNIERRKIIIQSMPETGLIQEEFIRHIMEFGYNQRGAREKMRELTYLKAVIIKGNKYYPVKSVIRTHARTHRERYSHTQGVQHGDGTLEVSDKRDRLQSEGP